MIKNKDVMDYLSSIPSNSIDLIIADPPYFKTAKEEWDHQWKEEDEYLAWCQDWMKECERVLKPNRCIYVWGQVNNPKKHPNTFLKFKMTVDEKTSLKFQNWIIWSYDWGGRTNKTFARKHEDLLMWSKGKKFLFNSDDVRIPYKMKNNTYRSVNTNHPLGKIPTDVWEKNNLTCSKEHCSWHPTTKNITLLRRMIRANTKEGDVVMDLFSGSGSTTVAAIQEKRKHTGVERDKDYYNKSLLRIKELTRCDDDKS